jgi:DNA polymerase V
LLERGLAPRNGDIVVARIDNEWTMKYLEKRGGVTHLRAANRKYPVIVPRQELTIAGSDRQGARYNILRQLRG